MKNNKGITFIELIISLSILGAMMIGATLLILSESNHRKAAETQTEKLFLKSMVRTAIRNHDWCNCQINPENTTDDANDANLVFDSTDTSGAQEIDLKKLRMGCDTTDPILVAEEKNYAPHIKILGVTIKNLKPHPSSANKWQGDLIVEIEPNSFLKDDSPINIKFSGIIDQNSVDTDPTQAHFAGCRVQVVTSGLIKNCPANYVMVGNPDKVGTFCISENELGPADYWTALATCHNNRPTGFGPALLCNPSQWTAGCLTGQMQNATNNWEWAYDNAKNNTTTMGNGSCDSDHWANFNSSLPFRCCHFM